MSESQLVSKLDLNLSNLTGGNGILPEAVAETFIRQLQEENPLLGAVRTVMMDSYTQRFPKVAAPNRALIPMEDGAGSRKIFATNSTREPQEADRVTVATSSFTLTAKEVGASVALYDEVLKDNIEGQAFQDVIISMLRERIGLDLADGLYNGDTASGDAFLAMQNGIRKALTSNVIDAAGAPLTSGLLDQAIKAMPTKFWRNQNDFRFMMHPHKAVDFRAMLGARQTGLGDSAIRNGADFQYSGISGFGTATLPNGDIVLSNPKNFIMGIWKEISVEPERKPGARATLIHFNLRVAYGVEDESAAVIIKNVG